MKLVDTSSWVEYLRGADSEAGNRVEALVLSGEAAWCDMTLVELWHGTRGSEEKRGLAEMEKEITKLAVDGRVWKLAFRLAARCREKGLTVPSTDLVIAACAVAHRVDLVHCDRHFDRILPLAAPLR